MKTMILALLALMFASSGVLAMGGQDILVDHQAINNRFIHDVTATEDGILFAVCTGDETKTLLSIYRSTDGGSKWTLWSELSPVTPDSEFNEVGLEVTSGSPGSLLVVWIEKGGSSPITGSWLQVAKAVAVEESPVWATSEIDHTSTFLMGPVSISARENIGPADRVCLAWVKDSQLSYATSTTGGTLWQAPLELNLLTAGAHMIDVAADALGVVHLIWGTADAGTDMGIIRYSRAVNNGSILPNWGPAQTLGEFPPSSFVFVTTTVEPDGDGVLVAASGDDGLALVTSQNAGLSWSNLQLYPGFTRPDSDWGDAGPFLSVDADSTSGLGTGRAIMSPGANFSGAWDAELMMAETTEAVSSSHMAVDPSRGGQPMIVCLQTLIGEEMGFRLWFDAAWRDAPGYGVPEPVDPYRTGGLDLTRAVLPGDMDGDSTLELLFSEATSAFSHTLKFYDPDQEEVVFSIDGLHTSADYALIDVDGDADLEAVYFTPNGDYLMARSSSGAVVFDSPVYLGLGMAAGHISGARVTGATEEDVVVAGGNTVWVLGPEGNPRPGFPWIAPATAGNVNGRVALGDVDGDGRLELVAPFTEGLFVLDRDGQLITQIGAGEPAPGSPSLHDFNGDQTMEITYPRADGSINLVFLDGTPVTPAWPFDTGATGMPSQVALGDVTGGGFTDLVFMDASSVLHLRTRVGVAPPDWPRSLAPGTAVVDPIVAQLGVNGASVALGEATGKLRLLERDRNQEGWHRDQTAPILAPVSAADIDGDGLVELLVPTSEALWILDMGVATTTGLWPISGGNPGRSGCVTTMAPSAIPTEIPVALDLRPAFPNPFNPSTVLSFHLPSDAGHASLRIYDVAGRLVKTLVEGPVRAGTHEVMWRGRDQHGNEVASGVYFYRLEADNLQSSRSMVLVR